MENEKLKPCPFCESDIVILDDYVSNWVECHTCHATASLACWQDCTLCAKVERLKIALAAAICRPQRVCPESSKDSITQKDLREAENRREITSFGVKD